MAEALALSPREELDSLRSLKAGGLSPRQELEALRGLSGTGTETTTPTSPKRSTGPVTEGSRTTDVLKQSARLSTIGVGGTVGMAVGAQLALLAALLALGISLAPLATAAALRIGSDL